MKQGLAVRNIPNILKTYVILFFETTDTIHFYFKYVGTVSP